jgi:hypothetical protein
MYVKTIYDALNPPDSPDLPQGLNEYQTRQLRHIERLRGIDGAYAERLRKRLNLPNS